MQRNILVRHKMLCMLGNIHIIIFTNHLCCQKIKGPVLSTKVYFICKCHKSRLFGMYCIKRAVRLSRDSIGQGTQSHTKKYIFNQRIMGLTEDKFAVSL